MIFVIISSINYRLPNRVLVTFEAAKTAAVMTLTITLAMPIVRRAIVRTYLHVAGFTGPHGVTGTRAFDTHTVAGTIDMGVSARNDAAMYTRYH